MDSSTAPYQRMLGSLRSTFQSRLPDGLTPPADARLQRTLTHYVREVTAAKGTMEEQEILRLTYDSMVGWFRRNTDYLKPAGPPSPPAPAPPTLFVSPTDRLDGEVDDPLALFQQQQPAAAPTELPASLVPIETRAPRPGTVQGQQSKDFLQKQEDVVKYREVEYNVILNSKDRNWLNNSKQNRYNFSIVLDAAVRPQGTGSQATIMNRFRNIVRLEFVKAILPVEALDVVVPKLCNDTSGTDVPTAFYSVLGLPYVNVTLDEYQANNYGTNDSIDRSFAICQYDATWRSDGFQTNDNTSRGFTLFFPKFMKAQRVYAPTPLGSFQKLSFQLLNPENQLLSCTPDAFAVSRIVFGSLNDASGSCYGSDASGGGVTTANYLFIQTKEFFPLWAFSQLDRITFAGLTFTTGSASPIPEGGAALIAWLQRDQGHVVTALAYDTGAGTPLQDGANSAGYSNYIIIRNRFNDPNPTTGAVTLDYFTGAAGTDNTLAAELAAYPAAYQDGGVLNLNRQVQLTLRVVTREMDSATNIRPDNV